MGNSSRDAPTCASVFVGVFVGVNAPPVVTAWSLLLVVLVASSWRGQKRQLYQETVPKPTNVQVRPYAGDVMGGRCASHGFGGEECGWRTGGARGRGWAVS
jgi:hypothetical protein